MTGTPLNRRRGSTLEASILDSGWQLLCDKGYSGFTFETVAKYAHTSKPVLYRRWSTKTDLLLAVLIHHKALGVREAPDTGSLRGDVLAMLELLNERAQEYPIVISVIVGINFDDPQMSPDRMRQLALSGRSSTMNTIVQRAVERGEVNIGKLPPMVVSLPFDLYVRHVLMTLSPLRTTVITQIVDQIFMPLVSTYCSTPDQRSQPQHQ